MSPCHKAKSLTLLPSPRNRVISHFAEVFFFADGLRTLSNPLKNRTVRAGAPTLKKCQKKAKTEKLPPLSAKSIAWPPNVESGAAFHGLLRRGLSFPKRLRSLRYCYSGRLFLTLQGPSEPSERMPLRQ